jgi:hypothetical protein
MQRSQAGYLSYPSLWLGGPALNAEEPFNRRCDQSTREQGRSQISNIGQSSSAIPADCTSKHNACVIWLDTASQCSTQKPVVIPRENGFHSATTAGRSTIELGRESLALGAPAAGNSDWELTRPLHTSNQEAGEGGSRSNQPPRLQSMLSEWDKREPTESRLRNLSAIHTDLNSHWLCLEEPFRNRLATRVSDIAAVQQEGTGGATYHRRLFQNTMPCPRPGRALLETSQRVAENDVNKLRNVNKLTSKTTEEPISLNRVGCWRNMQNRMQIRPLVCNSPFGDLEDLASLEKDPPGQTDREDEIVPMETVKCHGAGPTKSEATNSECFKDSNNVKPHMNTVHCRARRTPARHDSVQQGQLLRKAATVSQ